MVLRDRVTVHGRSGDARFVTVIFFVVRNSDDEGTIDEADQDSGSGGSHKK